MTRLSSTRHRQTLNQRKVTGRSSILTRLLVRFLSCSSLSTLLIGFLIGYVCVPMLLSDRLQFKDLVMTQSKPDGIHINNGSNSIAQNSAIRGTVTNNSNINADSDTFMKPPGVATVESNTSPEIQKSSQSTPTPLEMTSRIIENIKHLSTQSVPTATTPQVIKTQTLPDGKKKRIMVTGGAGFVGSHLVDKLMGLGHEVIVLDNFFTGQRKNVEHWIHHPNFSIIVHDVTEPIMVEVDEIYHLACPASPPHYQYNPVKTIKTSTMGTINMLGLAKRVKARMLLTSTSEVYGDPKVHPQPETYWGNVNTIGPRSCYDEGKRVAETMMYSYQKQNNIDVRVARIFNTFGPRMHPNDGRVVSNFIIQSLQGKDMTIYGDGTQTRSFQYVSDLVNGLYSLMEGTYDQPVNLGNPDEYTVGKFAKYVKTLTKSDSEIIFLEHSQDDPTQRKPVIDVARREIGWEPVVSVEDGLKKTIEYFTNVLKESGEIVPTGPGAAKPKGGD
jgi:UDP-glucuronate decarboxylase